MSQTKSTSWKYRKWSLSSQEYTWHTNNTTITEMICSRWVRYCRSLNRKRKAAWLISSVNKNKLSSIQIQKRYTSMKKCQSKWMDPLSKISFLIFLLFLSWVFYSVLWSFMRLRCFSSCLKVTTFSLYFHHSSCIKTQEKCSILLKVKAAEVDNSFSSRQTTNTCWKQ